MPSGWRGAVPQACSARAESVWRSGSGGRLQFRVPRALQKGERQHHGLRLLDGEHQRRQVEAGAQDIADAALALDRHAHRLQGYDIAVDRAHRHLQPFGDLGGGHRLAGKPEDLDDLEEPGCLAHGFLRHN
jgi:hypothetical protein